MKRIFICLIAALLSVAATAQIYRGEGGSFPLRYTTGSYDNLGYMRLNEPLATVFCYIDNGGKIVKQTFGVYFYSVDKEIEIKDSGEIAFCFADGTNEIATYEVFLQKSEDWPTGVRNIVGIEVETNLCNFKNKLLCKTIIDGRSAPWGIETPTKRAKKINKAVGKAEQISLNNALEAKARGEEYVEPFKWPAHVKKYLLEFYPEGTTFTGVKIDTVEVPARTLLSLEFTISIDMARLNDRVSLIASEMKGDKMISAVKKEMATADSLFATYDACFARIDSIVARNAKCEKNDYQNYQRVSVVYVLPDNSKGAIDVLTRLSEDAPSSVAMDFPISLEKVKKQLKQHKEDVEEVRKML